MPKLPVCSGKDVIDAFEKVGWLMDRQKGSHVTLIKEGETVVLTVPLHKEIDKGLLRSLIRKANLTVEDFITLL